MCITRIISNASTYFDVLLGLKVGTDLILRKLVFPNKRSTDHANHTHRATAASRIIPKRTCSPLQKKVHTTTVTKNAEHRVCELACTRGFSKLFTKAYEKNFYIILASTAKAFPQRAAAGSRIFRAHAYTPRVKQIPLARAFL